MTQNNIRLRLGFGAGWPSAAGTAPCPPRSLRITLGSLTQTFALLSGLLLLTACSTPSPVAPLPKFAEAESADFIARYFSDQTSYALKPMMMREGQFRAIFDRASMLGLARQQPRHELAVVVLVHYVEPRDEETAKLGWVNDLKGLGYQRIVFLWAGNNMEVNGLPVLESPAAVRVLAGK